MSSHIVILLFVLTSINSFAQKGDLKGYVIEGDEVVFTFNRDDYSKVTHDGTGRQSDFEDLDIQNVVVAGNFNDWSKDQWKMTKIDENTYQLRKKLSDFADEFSWEFKYVINNELWAEPSRTYLNQGSAAKIGRRLQSYNLRLFTAFPDKKGNVRFRLRGFEDAKKVIVSGTFNRWNEELFRMYKIENGWEIILQLRPNEYEYRFIVDGHWMEDPTNPDKVVNEFGEYNSHINVKKQVTFSLQGFADAKEVVLAGSFNDWNEHDFQMQKNDYGVWTYSLPLSGGKHHYKFIVDGNWIVDPDNTVQEYDGIGHINSVYMVK
ncbi:MAG: hypothetical protein R2797_12295 [Gelidibacter sp.]